MLRSRRLTPPLSCLTAFEAVARLGSVTDAARELDLTQSAVSRQLQKLETLVGTPLFERSRKRLHLTGAGARYGDEIRAALGRISNATIALQANPDGGMLNLAILPSFGTHWLAPRLPDFLRTHPGITLNMSTRTTAFDFTTEGFHAAIHFGQDDWRGGQAVQLWKEEMWAVGAPDLLQAGPAGDLPRLQLESRPLAWGEWARVQGADDTGRPAMVVDQFATMMRAAQAGLGLALMPDYLIGKAVEQGSLQVLAGSQPVSTGAYWLVWPQGGGDDPALMAFRDWLLARCSGPRASVLGLTLPPPGDGT